MTIIKEITANETLLVRQAILRPGKSIATCHFDGDDLASTKHFGYYDHLQKANLADVGLLVYLN